MKKSVLCLLIVCVIIISVVSARELTYSQKNITKIQSSICKFGTMRCYMNSLQECDGSSFVTRIICGPKENCNTAKGCIKKIPIKRETTLQNFYDFRLTQCKEGQFQCLGRFVKVCKNHLWMQEYCKKNEWCHPKKGCVEQTKMTALQRRDLYLPRVPKVPLLHYG